MMEFSYITFSGLRVVDSRLAAEFEAAAKESGHLLRSMDLEGIETGEDLMNALGLALSFPSYFARNWDAVQERMEDMEWPESNGLTLLVRNSDRLLALECIDVILFVRAVAKASLYLKEGGRSFETVLFGTEKLFLTVSPIFKPL